MAECDPHDQQPKEDHPKEDPVSSIESFYQRHHITGNYVQHSHDRLCVCVCVCVWLNSGGSPNH